MWLARAATSPGAVFARAMAWAISLVNPSPCRVPAMFADGYYEGEPLVGNCRRAFGSKVLGLTHDPGSHRVQSPAPRPC